MASPPLVPDDAVRHAVLLFTRMLGTITNDLDREVPDKKIVDLRMMRPDRVDGLAVTPIDINWGLSEYISGRTTASPTFEETPFEDEFIDNLTEPDAAAQREDGRYAFTSNGKTSVISERFINAVEALTGIDVLEDTECVEVNGAQDEMPVIVSDPDDAFKVTIAPYMGE